MQKQIVTMYLSYIEAALLVLVSKEIWLYNLRSYLIPAEVLFQDHYILQLSLLRFLRIFKLFHHDLCLSVSN